MSTVSAAVQDADRGPRGGVAQRIASCSAGVSTPSAAIASRPGSDSTRMTSRTGSTAGHVASTVAFTGLARRTES